MEGICMQCMPNKFLLLIVFVISPTSFPGMCCALPRMVFRAKVFNLLHKAAIDSKPHEQSGEVQLAPYNSALTFLCSLISSHLLSRSCQNIQNVWRIAANKHPPEFISYELPLSLHDRDSFEHFLTCISETYITFWIWEFFVSDQTWIFTLWEFFFLDRQNMKIRILERENGLNPYFRDCRLIATDAWDCNLFSANDEYTSGNFLQECLCKKAVVAIIHANGLKAQDVLFLDTTHLHLHLILSVSPAHHEM